MIMVGSFPAFPADLKRDRSGAGKFPVGRFLHSLPVSDSTKNETLAALRHFFDRFEYYQLAEEVSAIIPFHTIQQNPQIL